MTNSFPKSFLNKKSAGFTLIEILVVIAIIGLLASITLVTLKGVRKKAYIARALNYSAQVHHAIGAYLTAEYKFEGNLDDTSGNGNDGTWSIPAGTFVSGVPEIGGQALSLNGSNQYVNIGNIPALAGKNVTISAWVYWEGQTGLYDPIVIQCDDEYAGYYFYLYEDKLAFWLTIDQAVISPPAGFMDDWHFVAGTYDGVQIAVFIDGVLKGVRDIIDTGISEDAFIGFDGVSDYFHGAIDEVRIYEEVLTSAQIKKLYAEGVQKRGLLTKE